ncbi:MAG: hypothetical protein J6T12_00175 [Salinivirgaceae bacterium]|nr:hypothetical protein [Salinivirgaceae bacterium]
MKLSLLLHPLSERELVLENGRAEDVRRGVRGCEQRPFEKIVKKVLAGKRKVVTFATRFREEKDRTERSGVL